MQNSGPCRLFPRAFTILLSSPKHYVDRHGRARAPEHAGQTISTFEAQGGQAYGNIPPPHLALQESQNSPHPARAPSRPSHSCRPGRKLSILGNHIYTHNHALAHIFLNIYAAIGSAMYRLCRHLSHSHSLAPERPPSHCFHQPTYSPPPQHEVTRLTAPNHRRQSMHA